MIRTGSRSERFRCRQPRALCAAPNFTSLSGERSARIEYRFRCHREETNRESQLDGRLVARNGDLVRPWEVLREMDNARTGIGIGKLAALTRLHPRTKRRDIDARAGLSIYDEKINGTLMWKLSGRPLRPLEQMGLGGIELCAI